MRQFTIGLLLITAAVWSAFAAENQSDPSLPRAPDFLLRKCVLADSLHLADFANQPVLLFFFDAGDISTRPAYPYINEWHRRYENDGLKVIGIHCPQYAPLKKWENAATAIGRANLKVPIGMDWDWDVYKSYNLTQLPTFILLKPGLEPVFSISRLRSFSEIELAIQNLLKDLKPNTILPFILKPLKPEDNPEIKLLKSTPRLDFGYHELRIANCDSSAFGKFTPYTDPGDRIRDVLFLDGRWRVDEASATFEPDRSYTSGHIRVLYSGKAVWLLVDFPPGKPPRISVKQDRSYLPAEAWGNDIRFDAVGHPFISMRYAVPLHIVQNAQHGAHQLELVIEDGVATFYYVFFESGAEK